MSSSNRLADSTSPYLRQHANNPVDWYEWGPEALAKAVAEDKPILLSVGYSACHWCHVMAHESFEDPATAALMNESFVSIKVDREERLDIDAIYQKVVVLMGQGGGWPLTVFLTPDQLPFYGGTYFPPDNRYGRPGFPRLLEALASLWKDRRSEALEQVEAFKSGFADIAAGIDEGAAAGIDLGLASEASLFEAGRRLLASVDPEHGGFGRAPKFPNVSALSLMLRAITAGSESAESLTAALRNTLEAMWRGGIYDHLRGGFARYSVDREWLIPHFEKMLYDNALLLGLYADASRSPATGVGAPHLRRVVEETAAYLLADMRDTDGLFYSATDADSEGVEGKYFAWTPSELDEVLGESLGRELAQAHGVTEAGNFEHGWSVLHRPTELPEALDQELAPARAKLLERRDQRVPPHRDEKRITAWNALVITGFCKAADAAEGWQAAELAASWTEVARTACEALLRIHRDPDGRLLRASWAGRGHTRAYLEDVALLTRACLDLHERTLDPRWQTEAESLARECLDHYARAGGGFFDTADDGEALIERNESQHDSPLPSGVAVAIEALARLDSIGVDERGREQVERTISRFPTASARPLAYSGLIEAAQWASEQATHVTIRASSPAAGQALASAVRQARASSRQPISITFAVSSGDRADAIVCRARSCSMPIAEIEAVLAQLG